MVDDLCLVLLLLSTLAFVASAAVATAPPLPQDMPSTEQQLRNIVEALIGAGDFQDWVEILPITDLSNFPFSATLFIPSDHSLSRLHISFPHHHFDPLVILYHVVPQRLPFSDLQSFGIGSRLPTLLPNKSILVTNNARSNFTIDDCRITHPDLYNKGGVSVHGIGCLLNYSVYGSGGFFEDQLPMSPPKLQDMQGDLFPPLPAGESMVRSHSFAPCLCVEFPVVLSVLCTILAFKIHRNHLTLLMV